ncbi:MAG TPA: hypothetical protein VNQ73_07630 [Ilumatobacter sp.]|nr:hypothetical protein [Ilumatobacter sp.]
MRTTIDLDDDVEAAVAELMRSEGIGRSKAVNRLARRGAAHREPRRPYVHHTFDLGLKIDVANIGEVLGMLDDEEWREHLG